MITSFRNFLLFLFVLSLAACAGVPKIDQPRKAETIERQHEEIARAQGCKPYQKGLASWYGYELYGNKTANGEKFEPDGITAAHRTLPFGTKLLVFMDQGKGNPDGVMVRVNDRGPFIKGRVIDLSLGAAKRLGMKDTKPVHIYLCE